MIEVQLKQIINNMNVLKKLSEAQFKGKTAFQIARLLKNIEAEVDIFNTTRMKLLHQYAETDENGELKVDEKNNYIIKRECQIEFIKEMDEVMNNKIQINAEKIDYKDIENVEFTPSEAMALEPFIEF